MHNHHLNMSAYNHYEMDKSCRELWAYTQYSQSQAIAKMTSILIVYVVQYFQITVKSSESSASYSAASMSNFLVGFGFWFFINWMLCPLSVFGFERSQVSW